MLGRGPEQASPIPCAPKTATYRSAPNLCKAGSLGAPVKGKHVPKVCEMEARAPFESGTKL